MLAGRVDIVQYLEKLREPLHLEALRLRIDGRLEGLGYRASPDFVGSFATRYRKR
jgi:hypothetical protein